MSKKGEPKKPHTLKTAGREISGRTKGAGVSFLGAFFSIAGLVIFFLTVEGSVKQQGMIIGFIILVIDVIFSGTGGYMRRKARHVAWTQEAIERERYTSGKEFKCPKCGTWNSRESNYCTKCSLPLRIKCIKCKTYNFRDDKFCAECGRPVVAIER